MNTQQRKVMELALEALENVEFVSGSTDWVDDCVAAAEAIKEALAQPEQEPVALNEYDAGLLNDYGGGNVEWWQDYIRAELGRAYEHYQSQITTPPQRKPLTDEWVPVTQTLLNEQHPWLYQPMWIAMKDGNVLQGYYEWRQGRKPDRFHTTGDGDEWAFDAAYVMPIVKPTPPAIESAHGIKGKA